MPLGPVSQAQISCAVASSLPKGCGMEIQVLLAGQLPGMNVRRPTKTIPAVEAVFLVAVGVPQRIA